MLLSDLTIRQARANGTAYTLGDADGLSLHVSAHGGKSWHFHYYWAGRQKRISLGTYPEVHRQRQRFAVREASENTLLVVWCSSHPRRQP